MKDQIQDGTENKSDAEDLENYITQVVTDIGPSNINQDFINKITQISQQSGYDLSNKKLRWKMASVAYPSDVAPEEYSQFAIHVYQWLSYIKDLTPPTLEELREAGKMVDINRRKENSKFAHSHLFLQTNAYAKVLCICWYGHGWLQGGLANSNLLDKGCFTRT